MSVPVEFLISGTGCSIITYLKVLHVDTTTHTDTRKLGKPHRGDDEHGQDGVVRPGQVGPRAGAYSARAVCRGVRWVARSWVVDVRRVIGASRRCGLKISYTLKLEKFVIKDCSLLYLEL